MAHFLTPLIEQPDTRYILRNSRTGALLADRLEQAFDSASRRRGLLGRSGLTPATALILAPCAAIHTCFMRFSIDVIFARRDGLVIKLCGRVKPWRIAAARDGFAAIELSAGAIVDSGTQAGDPLELSRHDSSIFQ